MKTLPLLVWTVLLVLCHFATVTLGAPTLSGSQVKGHDLIKSFDDLNRPFIDAEECFKDAEEYFQAQGLITSTLSNRALGSKCKRTGNDSPFVEFKNSKTHSFISIPGLEGKSHVYVVQVAPCLGKGANGEVYLAKDIKIPDEFVAIKRTDTLIPEPELKGLELVGELLGSVVDPRPSMFGPQLFLVTPFIPGIKLGDLAENEYNGRPVYEYWTDENNKGYYTLLYGIARDIVAPLMNKFLIHNDLTNSRNMIVAQIDENYLPKETDPATGLQHFRAIDFGDLDEIEEGKDILDDIHKLARIIFTLPYSPLDRDDDQTFQKAKEIFQNAVIDALDKNKFDIKLAEDRMPTEVRRRRN